MHCIAMPQTGAASTLMLVTMSSMERLMTSRDCRALARASLGAMVMTFRQLLPAFQTLRPQLLSVTG